MKTQQETFTDNEIITAIKQWLEHGEKCFVKNKPLGDERGHAGYFSGDGWAARCLRFHLDQLTGAQSPCTGHATYAAMKSNPGSCYE
jgi:hypothetical protein